VCRRVQEACGATLRCLPFEEGKEEGEGVCVATGQRTSQRAIFAKAY